MRFLCIDDQVPDATIRLLRHAAERRGVTFEHIHASTFDYNDTHRAGPGDLMYRPAVSAAAQRVEQFLAHPQAATFHADPEGVNFVAIHAPMIHARAGLPVPRYFYCTPSQRHQLLDCVEALGGFPVVLKVPGGSRGVGVMRADSAPALLSLVDYAQSINQTPMLMPYIGDAVHWRAVVVGDRVVAAYRNPNDANDFRSYGSQDLTDFTTTPDPAIADVAVRAVQAVRLELGGVDILEHDSGRLYLLESNFPLYHAHAEEVAGIDVSGAMLDHLIAKACRLAGVSPPQPAQRPATRLHVEDGFLAVAELQALQAWCEPAAVAARGVALRTDATGISCELPAMGDAVLGALLARIGARVGVAPRPGMTMRLRRYEIGQGHPPHGDQYVIDGERLVATALLCVQAPGAGGETVFPHALPEPRVVVPQPGRLAWWFNYREDGSADTGADHLAKPVEAGTKVVLASFFYARPG